jgi:hypothetical protein
VWVILCRHMGWGSGFKRGGMRLTATERSGTVR